MKKIVSLMLALALALALVACGASEAENTTAATSAAEESKQSSDSETVKESEENQEYQLSGKTLRVGTMANSIGLPVEYASQQGWFDEIGLPISVELFSNGAVINESMAANQLDLAVSGMASVYALSTGMYTYIGDGVIVKSGQAMYARPDSPIIDSEGVIEGTLGSAESVKGVKVLAPASTTAHYQALKYVESFGLSTDDFEFINMEYPTAYQAFLGGEGDLIPTIAPYTTQLERDGYIKVCDVSLTLGSPQMDALYVKNDVIADQYDDVKAFLEIYYRACETLANDDNLRAEFATEWYLANGRTFTNEDMEAELENQTYSTLKTVDTDEYVFGSTMLQIGDFFTEQELIESSQLPNITDSMNKQIVQELKSELD